MTAPRPIIFIHPYSIAIDETNKSTFSTADDAPIRNGKIPRSAFLHKECKAFPIVLPRSLMKRDHGWTKGNNNIRVMADVDPRIVVTGKRITPFGDW